MEVRGQLHAPAAFISGRKIPVPIQALKFVCKSLLGKWSEENIWRNLTSSDMGVELIFWDADQFTRNWGGGKILLLLLT